MAFKEGKLVFAQPGTLPPTALEQVINAVVDLRMDDEASSEPSEGEGR
jgi:thioredoxin 1